MHGCAGLWSSGDDLSLVPCGMIGPFWKACLIGVNVQGLKSAGLGCHDVDVLYKTFVQVSRDRLLWLLCDDLYVCF